MALIIGVLATAASCVYLIQLGYQADASMQGGDGMNGWWQLIVSIGIATLGLVLLLSGATKRASR